MRVAFDTSSTRGLKTGIGTYTENLISALKKYAPEVSPVELEVHTLADQRTPMRILREQLVIPRLAVQKNTDILHLTGFAAPGRAACPVVLNAHDLAGMFFPENFPPVARFYWGRYLPFTLRFPDRIITLSQSAKTDVVKKARVDSSRVTVIPPGRDERFRPIEGAGDLEEARNRLGLPREFILFASTLEPRKGVDTIIEAFSRVVNEIPDHLVIVGKRGWYWESVLKSVERFGLEQRIHYRDYVPFDDLVYLYNLARLFVFPSRYEGFGLTPLEAMASGTPVVSSDSSSLPEVVGDAGILVPPADVDGFARAIKQVTADANLRRQLGERGLKRAREFSWERAAPAVVRVYEAALAHKRVA